MRWEAGIRVARPPAPLPYCHPPRPDGATECPRSPVGREHGSAAERRAADLGRPATARFRLAPCEAACRTNELCRVSGAPHRPHRDGAPRPSPLTSTIVHTPRLWRARYGPNCVGGVTARTVLRPARYQAPLVAACGTSWTRLASRATHSGARYRVAGRVAAAPPPTGATRMAATARECVVSGAGIGPRVSTRPRGGMAPIRRRTEVVSQVGASRLDLCPSAPGGMRRGWPQLATTPDTPEFRKVLAPVYQTPSAQTGES